MRNVVIVCAHPDDEVLGVGGAIQRHIDDGDKVTVIYVTDGYYIDNESEEIIHRRAAAEAACRKLGVGEKVFMGKKGLMLDTYSSAILNGELSKIFRSIMPDIVYTHNWGDINLDHKVVFDMVMVASRPHKGGPRCDILVFETLSSTEWSGTQESIAFIPNKFIEITEAQVRNKVEAFCCYGQEVQEYPNPRSEAGIINLARYRGQAISSYYAESFHVVRSIY
jgi:LmbE family N-acetylglucosaminyl deacetylase